MNDPIRKKVDLDFVITETMRYDHDATCLTLMPERGGLPEIRAGQFVNVLVKGVDGVMLRRPISVNFADRATNTLKLLVKNVGRGTAALCARRPGESLRILLPLGNGFTHDPHHRHPLLIGGGIGSAPMLYLGHLLKEAGHTPHFLLGARSVTDILQLELFEAIGQCDCATEDGSTPFQGLVTEHPSFLNPVFDVIYACGPLPMLKAVAKSALARGVECQVSLENRMACGLGACLCCVEDTKQGNRCTCTDGPVFNIKELKW